MDAGDWIVAAITVAGLYLLAGALAGWSNAFQYYGSEGGLRRRFEVGMTMLQACVRGRYRFLVYVYGGALLAPAVVMCYLSTTNYRWFLPAWGVIYLAALILFYAEPPAVLLLSTSKALDPQLATFHPAELLAAVHRGAHPHRVVYLLDPQATHVPLTSAYRMDNLRTSNDERWLAVVHSLADMVPLIVVDCRFQTDEISDEISYLRDHELFSKSLFVWDQVQGRPALTHADEERVLPSLVDLPSLAQRVHQGLTQAESAASRRARSLRT